jgi:preprotein translocase subunit SecD
VVLRLSTLGAQVLLRTTTAHQGQQIAVLINRRVVSVALVGAPLSGMLPVATDLPADQAEALADRIRSGIAP